MSRQKVNVDSIREDLKDSAFFQSSRARPTAQRPTDATLSSETTQSSESQVSRYHGTTVPAVQDTLVESIRRAVRLPGKEAATHRMSFEEKKAIKDIVYSYDRQGIRTSEMQITRIGVNFLLEDYQANGETSILAQVLEKLNQ